MSHGLRTRAKACVPRYILAYVASISKAKQINKKINKKKIKEKFFAIMAEV